jgi:23S rRNA maturation mini-RNase III
VRRPRSSYSESREVGAAKLQAGGMELTLNDLIKWHADQAEAAIERARNAAENDIERRNRMEEYQFHRASARLLTDILHQEDRQRRTAG